MKYIQTENAPKAVGPYTQAVVSGGFIFCSGQIGIDPKTNELVEGLELQTEQVLKNLTEVLHKGGSSLDKVVKTTIFLADIKDYGKVNEIYGRYFMKHKTARVAVTVANLPKNAEIEIDVIAEVRK